MYVDIVISNIFYLNKHFSIFSFFFFSFSNNTCKGKAEICPGGDTEK